MQNVALRIAIVALITAWQVPVLRALDKSASSTRIIFRDSPETCVLRVHGATDVSRHPYVTLEIFGDGQLRVTRRQALNDGNVTGVDRMRLAQNEVQSLLDAAAAAGVFDIDSASIRRSQHEAGLDGNEEHVVSDLGGYLLEVKLAWYQSTPDGEGFSGFEHRVGIASPQYYASLYPENEQFKAFADLFHMVDSLMSDPRLVADTNVTTSEESEQ